MAKFPVKTKDGILTLDTNFRTVYLGGQGGSIVGGSVVVDSAGAVDKRITATRSMLVGPLALVWRKKKDERELYLLVEDANILNGRHSRSERRLERSEVPCRD